jgi:hypothetical protein
MSCSDHLFVGKLFSFQLTKALGHSRKREAF